MKSIIPKQVLFFTCLILFFSSCIVRAPKYTGIEEVLRLKTGMTFEEASKTLGLLPYDLKSLSDSESVYIYKYRTTDRKTFPLFMNKTNGVKAKGKWVDLFVTYDKDGKLKNVNSCSDCEETKVSEKKIDFNSILLLITVSLPAVLVYFGLKNP